MHARFTMRFDANDDAQVLHTRADNEHEVKQQRMVSFDHKERLEGESVRMN